jgi:pimeloyl-ACP methyl ester carboxylesterase
MQTHSFIRDDCTLVYDQLAASDTRHTLVLLHGLASNASRWHEFMHDTSLSSRFDLLAMDLRGHGRSLVFDAYTRQDWIEDVHALLGKAQKPGILIGHSMGAQIALDYAAQDVSRETSMLEGLILIDPIFPKALHGVLKRVARWRPLIRAACWLLRVGYAMGLHRRHYPQRDLHQLDQQTRKFLAANPHKSIADLYMDPLADLPYIPLANYLQDLYEVTRPLLPLANIRVPVLVLLSAGASTSSTEINQNLLSALGDLEINIIDADHWLLTERPREAREAIERWCERKIAL